MPVTPSAAPRHTWIALCALAWITAGCTPASTSSEPQGEAPNPGRSGGSAAGGSGGKAPPAITMPAGSGGAAPGNNPDPSRADAAPSPAGSGGAGSPSDPAAGDAGSAKGDAELPAAPDAGGPVVVGPDGPRIGDGLTQMLVTRAIGLGYYHACHLLASKDIKCYGTPATEPRLMPPAIKSDQVFCAHNGCCVLTGGSNAASAEPDPVLPEGTTALMIRAKRLACWGHKNTFFPPAAMEMDPIQFGIGYDHGCVLNADHTVACWGQPGTMNAPPAGLTAKSITIASFFNCAVKMDDSVVCWGINPPQPPAGLKAKMVAAIFHSNPKLPDAPTGTRHACAIQLDDTVKCWGDNVAGTTDVPADLGPVKDIATATYNSCALKLDGSPVCWGTKKYNESAQRFHPMPAGLHLKGFRSKLAAYCGLNLDDTMSCWGDESSTHLTIPADTKFYTAP